MSQEGSATEAGGRMGRLKRLQPPMGNEYRVFFVSQVQVAERGDIRLLGDDQPLARGRQRQRLPCAWAAGYVLEAITSPSLRKGRACCLAG